MPEVMWLFLKWIGILLGLGTILGIIAAFIWDPLKEKYPAVAETLKKIAIAAVVLLALVYGTKSCEDEADKRQEEHDRELWEEAYDSGVNAVINNPEQYISFDGAYEAGYADGYDDGYLDGWNDCKDGVPLENPVIERAERMN